MPDSDNTAAVAATVMAWADELGRISESPDGLTRTYLTPEHRQAAAQVEHWMHESGMTTHLDAVGNMVGRYEGATPGRPALLFGSHLDTVRDAGQYDGALGVLLAIACVGVLHRAGERPPFAIEVIGFAEEEGVRFRSTMIGSSAVAGTLTGRDLALTDETGVTVAEAMHDFGLDPDAVGEAAHRPEDVLAYVEAHIEQGPVLENEGLAVGTVTAIAGISRFHVTITGMAGHAGTVPMDLRQDALAAAAECVLAVEAVCGGTPGMVGTVGRLDVSPGADNVIPGAVRFGIDMRSGDDAVRAEVVDAVRTRLREICARRGLPLDIVKTHENACTTCAPWLRDRIADAVEVETGTRRELPSGAGHDAMALTGLTDVAMLFLRCTGGISHNPAESVTADDVDVALRVLLRLIRDFQPKAS